MADRDGRKATAVELPIEVREAMKDEDAAMWKVVDEAVRMYLGIGTESTEAGIERRISELERERNEHLEAIQERANRIQEIDDLLEDLVADLESLREKKASYDEQLHTILEELQESSMKTVLAYQSEIRQAAIDEYGQDTQGNIERVVNDLRKRSEESNYAIADHQFRTTSGPTPTSGQTATADGGEDGLELSSLMDGGDD